MAKTLHYRGSKIDLKNYFEMSYPGYDTFTKRLLFSSWQFSIVEVCMVVFAANKQTEVASVTYFHDL